MKPKKNYLLIFIASMFLYIQIANGFLPNGAPFQTTRYDFMADPDMNFQWWAIGGKLESGEIINVPVTLANGEIVKINWWKYPYRSTSWINRFPTGRITVYTDALFEGERWYWDQWADYFCGKYNYDSSRSPLQSIVIVLYRYQGDLWQEVRNPSDAAKFKRRSVREIIQIRSCSANEADMSWFWQSMMPKPNVEFLNNIHSNDFSFLESGKTCFVKDAYGCGKSMQYVDNKMRASFRASTLEECQKACSEWMYCSHFKYNDAVCDLSASCARGHAYTRLTNFLSYFKHPCHDDGSLECVDIRDWDGGHGGCTTYYEGMENHKHCSEHMFLGSTAKETCPQCLKCKRSAMYACVSIPDWDAGYGNCSQYAFNMPAHKHCSAMRGYHGKNANDVCPECGMCTPMKSNAVILPDCQIADGWDPSYGDCDTLSAWGFGEGKSMKTLCAVESKGLQGFDVCEACGKCQKPSKT